MRDQVEYSEGNTGTIRTAWKGRAGLEKRKQHLGSGVLLILGRRANSCLISVEVQIRVNGG